MIHWGWLLLLFVLFLLACWFMFRQGEKYGEERYYEGIQDGQKLETADAVRKAIEEYQTSLNRKLHDSGRRYMARPDAPPATVHKARITSGKPDRPLK